MFLADYHSHTLCSPDSAAPLADMARAALDAGLSELCVTDHCDLLDQDGNRTLSFDWSPCLAQFAAARPMFEGRLTLRLGLELGSGQIDAEAARAILDRPELDFVIGSLHNHTEAAGGGDFYFTQYTSPELCREALDDYFTAMAELAALPERYDVLGHILYPLRYMERDGQSVSLDPYRDRLADILRTAIGAGRGVELNTWCGRTVEAWRPILTLYRDLGGEIVTVGADAHSPDNVGRGVPQACDLLRVLGFRYLTVYAGRRPEFIKLN